MINDGLFENILIAYDKHKTRNTQRYLFFFDFRFCNMFYISVDFDFKSLSVTLFIFNFGLISKLRKLTCLLSPLSIRYYNHGVYSFLYIFSFWPQSVWKALKPIQFDVQGFFKYYELFSLFVVISFARVCVCVSACVLLVITEPTSK